MENFKMNKNVEVRNFARFYLEYNPVLKKYIKKISFMNFLKDDLRADDVIKEINKKFRKYIFKEVNKDYIDKIFSSGFITLRSEKCYVCMCGKFYTIECINLEDIINVLERGAL